MTTFNCNLIGWRSDFFSVLQFLCVQCTCVWLSYSHFTDGCCCCIHILRTCVRNFTVHTERKIVKNDKNPFEQIRKFGMWLRLMCCVQWEHKPVSLSIRRWQFCSLLFVNFIEFLQSTNGCWTRQKINYTELISRQQQKKNPTMNSIKKVNLSSFDAMKLRHFIFCYKKCDDLFVMFHI